MGKVVFETKLHTYTGKKDATDPESGTVQSHNNLTLKYG